MEFYQKKKNAIDLFLKVSNVLLKTYFSVNIETYYRNELHMCISVLIILVEHRYTLYDGGPALRQQDTTQ